MRLRQLIVSVFICTLLGMTGAAAVEAAAPVRDIAFVGVWDRAKPLIERASRACAVPVTFPQAGDSLIGSGLVLVLNLRDDDAGKLKERLVEAHAADSKLLVLALDERGSQATLRSAGLLNDDPHIAAYWSGNGAVNIRNMLTYAAVTYLGGSGKIEAPVIVPSLGYYHPGLKGLTEEVAVAQGATNTADGATRVAILIQHSFWVTEDTKVIDAEISALERQGFAVLACLADGDDNLNRMLRAWKPALIVEDRHGGMASGSDGGILAELDVPYLRPISLLDSTIAQWQADAHGLGHREEGLFLTLQEPRGTIEPMVIGGLKVDISGFRLHEPIPERIERFAARARSWANLRELPNADKHIAIVYYNKSLGKGDLMRGSPTGGFLDGPASLVRFLPMLRERGYEVGTIPITVDELIEQIREHGRNIGPWDAGDLERMADAPQAILVPADRYGQWFTTKLSKAQQATMIDRYGPPPGKLMVVRRNGRSQVVLPIIRLGNVVLGAQPARGEKQDESLLHDRDIPPPHNYLAFYWWLQEEFNANAVVHWGTHGTIEMQPGKETGLSSEDWGDVCVGTMPMITPWIMDNVGEATVARRRSYAVLVDHQVPPAVNTGLGDALSLLHDDVHKFRSLADGLLREEFRREIAKKVHQERIDETLDFDTSATISDEELEAIERYLHHLEEERTPASLHVLGVPPNEEDLPDYMTAVLGEEFIKRIAESDPPPATAVSAGHQDTWLRTRATELVQRSVFGDEVAPEAFVKDIAFAREVLAGIRDADVEVRELLHALDGGFIRPGPGPDPIRNSISVPAGRNLFGLNPEEIPTRPSWEVAVRLVDEMFINRQPKKIAFDLSGMNTMQDFGVIEGEILYLMGVRPVWDRNNLASDVELIPREELKRDRVDVFIAMGGQYKENFPTRVRLIDKAVRMVSHLDEPGNAVRSASLQVERGLLERGFAANRARELAHARIFGTKPGNLSGTNILYLIPRSGAWQDDDELNAIYVDHMSYVYSGETWGERIDGLYEEAIQGTDTLMRVWSSHMSSQLSNHHAYEYLGGLSMAVTKLTGHEPEALIADVRDPRHARIRTFEEVLASNLRSELLNKKWIEGMRANGYAGAGHMTELVKNTFGWDVTRSSSVSDGVWNDIHDIYVNDRFGLGLPSWFEQENPHAYQELLATMLEANRKGYWNADAETIAALARRYAELVSRTQPAGGLVTGGNQALEQFVGEQLSAPSESALVKQFHATMTAAQSSPDAGEKVEGSKLEAQVEESTSANGGTPTWWPLAVAALGLLVVIGVLRRTGSPS